VEIRNDPPADLLICPPAPAGFSPDLEATIPVQARQVLINLARYTADLRQRLSRLIAWHDLAEISGC
jgi:hypothetical protein